MNTGRSVSVRIAVPELSVSAHAPRNGQPVADEPRAAIIVIDRCEPTRRYLVRCLEEATDGADVIAFASAAQWLQVASDRPRPRVVLLCNSGCEDPENETEEDLLLPENLADVPVIAVPGTDATTGDCTQLSQPASSSNPTPCEALTAGRGEQASLKFSRN